MNQTKKTSKNINFKGGVRMGLLSSSWPFGVLRISEEGLSLKDSARNKTITFKKEDIVKLTKKSVFPLLGKGIQIQHSKKDEPKKVIFWYWGPRIPKLLESLRQLGWVVE